MHHWLTDHNFLLLYGCGDDNDKGPFGNVVLVTLFEFFGNTCGWKSVKIRIMLFKNWKHVFKHMYQMTPKYLQMLPKC